MLYSKLSFVKLLLGFYQLKKLSAVLVEGMYFASIESMTYHNPFRVLVQEGFLCALEVNVIHLDDT